MLELFSLLLQVYRLSPSTSVSNHLQHFTFTACQTPAALLQQISSLRSEKQDMELEAQIISRPTEHKKDLIQVISSTFVQPQKPEYQLQVKIDAAGVPRSVELTVELPKVRSVSECQLRISEVSSHTLPWTVLMNHFRVLCMSMHGWMSLKIHNWPAPAVLNAFTSAGWRLAGSGGCLLFASGVSKTCQRRHCLCHL